LKPGIRHLAEVSGAPVFPVRIDGVTGQGQTLMAVIRRSRAKLTVFPPLQHDPDSPDQLLEQLAPLLSGKSHPREAGQLP
jgi:1-acyl-sn-glycerol-3-phosphate acyltransferase